MKNYKITTPSSGDFIMPSEALKYIDKASSEQLKVLIYCAAHAEFELSSAARECGLDTDAFVKALGFWTENGVFAAGEKAAPRRKPNELLQSYDTDVLSDALEKDGEFATIKSSVEDLLGKVLNRNDINLLYNMYHFAGMNADYICTVAAYSAARGKPSMLYITQTALGFYDDGADTYEKLELMLAERQTRESERAQFISLCGFGSRKLTSKENALITKWFSEMELSFGVVRTGYDKMVDTIGGVKLSYLDKILTEWYESGIKDEEAAKEAASNRKNDALLPEDSFDADEFIKAAMNKGVK